MAVSLADSNSPAITKRRLVWVIHLNSGTKFPTLVSGSKTSQEPDREQAKWTTGFMKLRYLFWIGIANAGLAGCSGSTEPADAPTTEMPPTPVKVAEVLYETITVRQEFTGRLEASETVAVRPRVSGYISKVAFKEGSPVAAGDLLFEIDPRPFRLEVARLQADLKSAHARQKLTSSDLQRAQRLRSQKAIAVEELEARQADLEQARALVESVRAQLETERLKLSFTRVIAPIDGQASNARITAGNYVTEGETLLTTLVSMNEMHAYFNADERTYLRLQKGQQLERDKPDLKVIMKLTTDREYLHNGQIDFIDNQINPQTGTMRFRALFDNTSQQLTPGLFVRLGVAGSPLKAILVDDKTIATDLANKYVLVLGTDNTLEYRQVTPGEKYAGLRIIHDGLNAGERIVTKGLQQVFPGSKVVPEEESMVSHELKEKYFGRLAFEARSLTRNQSDEASPVAR